MKKMKLLFYFTITAMVMITACQPKSRTSAVDTRADADTIRNLEDRFAIAEKESNVDKIVSFYAPDAVAMCANQPIAKGLQAIRELKKTCFADTAILYTSYTSTIDNIEVSASGDLAYARGSDRVNLNTTKGMDVERGKWLDAWRKIDGRWKAIATTWNSDTPLPKP